MPIYEYQCADCGFRKEVIQKISDEPLKLCPECGKSTMKKMVSAAAFRLKGGGWYETDFKAGKQKNLADTGTDKKPADKSADSSGGKPASADKAPASGSTSTSKKQPGTNK